MADEININNLSEEELAEVKMIGRERARAIKGYISKKGPLKSWDDFKQIPGFSDQLIEDLKDSGIGFGREEQII